MNLQLVSISQSSEPETYEILVVIGVKRHKLKMKVESFAVAGRVVQVTNGDDHFSETFRFNQIIASDICKLVAKFHNYIAIELPADLGEFYPDKIKATKIY